MGQPTGFAAEPVSLQGLSIAPPEPIASPVSNGEDLYGSPLCAAQLNSGLSWYSLPDLHYILRCVTLQCHGHLEIMCLLIAHLMVRPWTSATTLDSPA